LGLALLVLLLPVSTLDALAEQVEQREQELQYIVGEKYTVIIPEKIVLEDADATGVKGAITADVTIKASHEALMIPPETMLQVSIGEDNDFLLTRAGGGDPTAMSYVVKKGSSAGHEIGTKGLVAAAVSGRNDSDVTTTLYLESTTALKYSGTYTDTLNFSIDVAPYYADFGYTGAVQTFVAPTDGVYELAAWGAAGGNGQAESQGYSTYVGGAGGYVSGELQLTAGQVLYVAVGEHSDSTTVATYGGGGKGGFDTAEPGGAGSGGGATDFRLLGGAWDNAQSLNSRIIVAGGGGGSEWVKDKNYVGGAGGGLQGYEGKATGGVATKAQGGTQLTGGTDTSGNSSGVFGVGGHGGHGSGSRYFGGGGGGGYYGGGAALGIVQQRAAGGGGSSFISGYSGCVAIADTANDTANPRTAKTDEDISVMTYAGKAYQFTNAVMKDGQATDMPDWQHAGATMTGNAGNGHAKVTLKRYTD
jgi:hypothetical protein